MSCKVVKSFKTQRGFALVDTLVGLAILGVFVVTLLGATSAGLLGLVAAREEAVSESLTRSQLEYIKSQTYQAAGGYAVVTSPSDYSITAQVGTISGTDPNTIQEIVVTVYRSDKVVRVISDFKVNR